MLLTSFNKDTRVFSGRKCVPIYNPRASLGHLLYENFLKDPKIGKVVKHFHSVLKNQVNAGDVVNSIVPGLDPDDQKLMQFYVAAILNGNPIHFIDHRSGVVEVDNAVQVTNAKTIILPEDYTEQVDQDGNALNAIINLIDSANPSPVAYFTTAGISGLPKLVPLSAESIIHHMSNPLHNSFSALSFLPLSKYRIFLDAITKLVKGSKIRLRTVFSLDTFNEECMNDPFQELHLTNYQLAKIVADSKCSIKFVQTIHLSGCYANPILIRRAQSVFPNAKIVYSYGLTEFGSPVAINSDAGAKYTVGQLNDNFEVSIRDEQGEKLGFGFQGEIYIKSPVPFVGYFRNEEASRETLTDDNWCRTGDIGYFDEDFDLHILDRDKDVIIYDCNVISPTELEFYLKKLEGVKLVKVYAVNDPEKGELPAAKIVTHEGVKLTPEAVNDFVTSQLGPLKILRGGVFFVDSL